MSTSPNPKRSNGSTGSWRFIKSARSPFTIKFEVPANSETGFEFTNTSNTDITYNFTPSGTWEPVKANLSIPACSAQGFTGLSNQDKARLTYPNNTAFSLLAVNKKTGTVTSVTGGTTITLKAGGTLQFMINEIPNEYEDNRGSITVEWTF